MSFTKKIDAILADETNWDSECLRPTERATANLYEIIKPIEKAGELRNNMPYPDGEGGWRVDFACNGKSLTLAVDAVKGLMDYIYVQEGDKKGTLVWEPNAGKLREKLSWMRLPMSQDHSAAVMV